MSEYNIGIDIGGTNIKIGIVNYSYEIIFRSELKTDMPRPAKEIAVSIAEKVMKLCMSNGIKSDEIKNIGIGSPGTVDNINGIVLSSGNLNFNNVPLGGMLEELLQKKVRIENDANAAAFGEYLAGGGKGYQNVVVITLGTGVGSGIIINGRIYSGYKFCGAEIGHMVIQKGGIKCTCGRQGCLEMYASATALIRMTKEAMVKDKSSKMWDIAKTLDEVDGKTAFDGMRKNDYSAVNVINEYIDILGAGLTNVVNIFQPEIILIGGGLSAEKDNLLLPLRKYISKEAFYEDDSISTKINIAKLGNDAGIIGAAFSEI